MKSEFFHNHDIFQAAELTVKVKQTIVWVLALINVVSPQQEM